VARYKKLDIPEKWVGINPDLQLRRGPGGKMDVTISYPRDFAQQQLAYARINGE
jgi:hypothetical protein